MKPPASASAPALAPGSAPGPAPAPGQSLPAAAPVRRDVGAALRWAGAGAFAAAGLVHVALLAYIFASRLTAPFDLEWMEGGMLTHALRLMNGDGIYVEPSSAFIAYLYTPGYPALLAALGKVFGLSYALGRAVSVASFAVVCVLVYRVVARQVARSLAGSLWEARLWAIGVLGLLCASFQYTGAWYDLVRNDSLYLALVMSGMYLLYYHHTRTSRLVLAGVLLGLGFLTKQTTSIFIIFSGFALMSLRWRRLPLLVAVVGAVAGGGTLLLNMFSDGWFWEYIFQLHQGHDVYWDRMLITTPGILAKNTPVAAGLFVLWVLVAIGASFRRRRLLASEGAATYWFFVAFTGAAVACTGYGTQWADFNAFIPGLVFPALFAALAASDIVRRIGSARRPLLAGVVALLFGGALAAQLVVQLYSPKKHVPRKGDRDRARALVAVLSKVRGSVLFPYHPFMPYLAGKPTWLHQMGINDITRAGHPYPDDLREALRKKRFAAVVLDKPPDTARYGYMLQTYKLERYFPASTVPLVVTGYHVRPKYLLVPKGPAPPLPKGARRVFGFEQGSYKGWKRTGRAFGGRPVGGTGSGQLLAGPFEGSYLASSFVYGDSGTGRMLSPPFTVDKPVLTYRVGGGRLPGRIIVRLLVDGKEVHRGTGSGTHVMKLRRVDVKRWQGKSMRVELVDRATKGGYAHLYFDDLVLRDR